MTGHLENSQLLFKKASGTGVVIQGAKEIRVEASGEGVQDKYRR